MNEALKLARSIQKIRKDVIICPQIAYLEEIAKNTKLKIYAQHVDGFLKGRHTGYILPEAIKAAGAKGSLLNHSEHPISIKKIRDTLKICDKLNLKVICCASSLNKVEKIKKMKPYAIAYEDPKLISTGKSITKYNPKSIEKFVKLLKGTRIIPICGAGISNRHDIKAAEKLGCKGVLIASAIAKKNKVGILK